MMSQLISSMTVKENVEFSAYLRLNNTKKLPKKQLDEKLLSDLILKHISNRKVGSCIKSNISNGERKRVAIAMENVISPNFLYLD
ncbi:hypothetical protein A3Q56_04550 [Intoshia linei]|uniref:ABC transporter domain-containing protein n=1 Tax=Intoshia linei TaxID=1819745 RepID=A0A177B264_9BILA|nr:hypothetical protein A3Q56_04550 [Intoshia linei]